MSREIVFSGNETGEMRDLPDWIPTRRITIHPGAGLDTEGAVALINAGKVPTRDLLSETFSLDQFEDAFSLLTRKTPGRNAVRIALRLS
jgi:threonine dehydrogenase-like Zn-dependent dehydrogenase